MPSTVAAIPLHRNAVIFSRCQIGTSARSTTAILVSKRISCFPLLFAARFGGTRFLQAHFVCSEVWRDEITPSSFCLQRGLEGRDSSKLIFLHVGLRAHCARSPT